MDLIKTLKEEVNLLNLTDELSILFYLYYRTGEIFDYDPKFELYDKGGKEFLNELEFDAHNINKFELVCTPWAKIFISLLQSFGIKAELKDTTLKHHPQVLITLSNNEKVVADLMIFGNDIVKIKLGMKLNHFILDKTNNDKELLSIQKETKYFKGITTEEVLEMIKCELQDNSLTKEEQILKVFDAVALIINYPRKRKWRYCSVSKIIADLIIYFQNTRVFFANFYNIKMDEYIDVYELLINNKPIYYVLKKDNENNYKFIKTTEEEINNYLNNYEGKYLTNLKRIKR